jgi:hypothetical protein
MLLPLTMPAACTTFVAGFGLLLTYSTLRTIFRRA